jgi:hypothetical protein
MNGIRFGLLVWQSPYDSMALFRFVRQYFSAYL